MLLLQERHSKRFHITLQVPNLEESIEDYCEILGEQPCCVISGRLALWRTSDLNLLLRAKPKQRVAVLQLGWEFDYLENIQRFKDCNQLSWLFFATTIQDEAINRLNVDLKYNEHSDFLLELRNPNAHWNLWASILLIMAMAAFTLFNKGWLAQFFRPMEPKAAVELQELYSANAQLQAVGKLLEQAGYQIDYLEQYAIALHPKHARITFQIINQQILFSTYWSLRGADGSGSADESPTASLEAQDFEGVEKSINDINREAIMSRYFLDEEGDLTVEAWFPLAPLLLLDEKHLGPQLNPELGQEVENGEGGHADQIDDGDNREATPGLDFGRQQAMLQWQRILDLWQQESLDWLQTSDLFGGDGGKLEPHESFSKK